MPVPFTMDHAGRALTMLGWFSKDAGNLGVHGDGACLAAGSRRRLWGDRRGNVAIIMAATAIPVVIAVGAGVDLSRMARTKATLQNAADAAALAGATLYTSAGQSTVAQTNAQSYFDKYALGGDIATSSRTVTPAQSNSTSSSSTSSSRSVTVSATATLPTTFGGLVGLGTMTVNATAVAGTVTTTPAPTTTITPLPQTPVVQLGTGGGSPSQLLSPSPSKSTAADWNSVYIYGVPKGSNGQYDYTSFPPLAQFYEIGSNCSGAVDSQWTSNSACNGQFGTTVKSIPSFTLPADQPIALMFVNMNNGMFPSGGAGGYGPNQYGSKPGYFQVMTTATMALGQSPSQITDNSVNVIKGLTGYQLSQTPTHYSDVNNSTLSNCAVQIVLVTDVKNPPTQPPYPGVCLSATDGRSGYKYANLSCSQIAGRTFMYWWNDMGASRDDFDYKNLYFTLTCSNTTTNPDGGTVGKDPTVTGQVPATTTTTTTTPATTTTPKLIQ